MAPAIAITKASPWLFYDSRAIAAGGQNSYLVVFDFFANGDFNTALGAQERRSGFVKRRCLSSLLLDDVVAEADKSVVGSCCRRCRARVESGWVAGGGQSISATLKTRLHRFGCRLSPL